MFFVYFLVGHLFRDRLFSFAAWGKERPRAVVAGVLLWAAAEATAVHFEWTEYPGATLVFGLAGGIAVVAASVLAAQVRFLRPLAYCGRHSLPVYLGFFAPMAATRLLLAKTGFVTDVGAASVIVTTVAVGFPLVLNVAVRGTPLAFLFERPRWARITPHVRRASARSFNRSARDQGWPAPDHVR